MKMKKVITTLMVGAVLSLAACAADGNADYGYETNAPYANERTVGDQKQPMQAERTFEQKQRK